MTKTINDAVAAVLQTVRTPGDFCAWGHCSMHLPQIEVESVGTLALPLLPDQAARLITVAERAPYGRGSETLVDAAVRRTWQIGADRVRIAGRHWPAMLQGVVQEAAAGLGAGIEVQAELYKLLVYDEGSFFLSHRDTEKSAGMFATLVLALPSLHAGGELVVRHRDREVSMALRSDDLSELAWAAFYADCPHEVLPVSAGCRLVLVYNLLRKGQGSLPRPPSYEQEQSALSQLLRGWGASLSAGEGLPRKLVYPLAHAYTPAQLSLAALKGEDAAAAGVLATAARDAACDLHAALLRIEESGSAEYTGYSHSRRSRYHDDDDAQGFSVDEVIERSMTLSNWCGVDGEAAALGELPFSDAEICPGDALQDMEPDEQHFQEATGNEGASFERSYQRAALVLWPHVFRLALLAGAGFSASLPALAGMLARWQAAGAQPGDPMRQEALALVGQMRACWPRRATVPVGQGRNAAHAVLGHLVSLQDPEQIDAMLAVTTAGDCVASDNAAIVQALQCLPASRACQLLQEMVQAHADLQVGGCAELLARASAVPAWQGGLPGAARALLDAMPGDPARASAQADGWRREKADASVLANTLTALQDASVDDLAEQAVSHWLAWPAAFGFDAVIVPALRQLVQKPAVYSRSAAQRLRAAALHHLRTRVALDLAPPRDWRRGANLVCRCDHCQGLAHFLQDARQPVWRFAAREALRRHVEDSIRQSACDVDCLTERKGSPHVLVCTKNQASHEARVRQRREDLDDLQRLQN